MRAGEIEKLLSVGEDSAIASDDPRIAALRALAEEMGDPPPNREAPVREVLARLGDNWSPLILKVLATGTFRHATLKRVISDLSAEPEISQRMLTLRLRALERDGFVSRQTQDLVPPRVVYSLTPLGLDLVAELNRLLSWVGAHSSEIETARSEFIE